jgi:serine/threonine protein kinase
MGGGGSKKEDVAASNAEAASPGGKEGSGGSQLFKQGSSRVGSTRVSLKERTDPKEVFKTDFKFGRCYHKSDTCEIVAAELVLNKKWYAAKIVHKQRAMKANPKLNIIHTEVAILTKVDHQFISTLHYSFLHGPDIYLITELMTGGTLADHFKHRTFSVQDVAMYGAMALEGLNHLHELRIIHRGIQPSHLLLGIDGYIKLTGFTKSFVAPKPKKQAKAAQPQDKTASGRLASSSDRLGSSMLGQSTLTCNQRTGVIQYMAPEMFCTNPRQDMTVDFYALGCTLYELLYLTVPYEKGLKQVSPYLDKAKRDRNLELPPGYEKKLPDLPGGVAPPESLKAFINGVLEVRPWKRVGFSGGAFEVWGHPFFHDIDRDGLLARTLPPPFIPDPSAVPKTDHHDMSMFGGNERKDSIAGDLNSDQMKKMEQIDTMVTTYRNSIVEE